MATTSLWHIEGRLKDLIAYVENPEKTVANNPSLQPLWEVMSYVSRPEATEQGEYVSTINCLKEIALQQMILTKKQYGKENGYIAWHGYQSFKPDEVTEKEAHEIGLQTAREMWGDKYQIIVTTHLDKDHLHNHFCFNSVSFIDGKKYDYSKAEQRKLRSVSDRICAEHGLSVIKNPHKAPSRQVWLDEKNVSLPVITCTVKICEKPLITAEVQNISKNIYREKDILPTSRVSIGRYDYRSTNTLQDLIPLMKDGLPKI